MKFDYPNSSAKSATRCAAFTMIELLVAMAILLIIVAIVAQIFQQANVAWSTGIRSVEMTMKGRSVADLIAQELSQAVKTANYPDFAVNGSGADFWMLGDASNGSNAVSHVTYAWSGATFTRGGVVLAEGLDSVNVVLGPVSAATPLPPYITVSVSVSNNIFQTKAFLNNRFRYAY